MKKILSLLSMLMITVTAFATSYTDKLTYKLTVFTALTKDLPAGELTIEPYGASNYTVTAKGCDLSDFDAGNWDEIVCEDVAGTKDANGVTTITLDNPYAYRTSDNTAFTDTKLVVKFKGTKAYAHFEGKMKVMYVARAFEYTFGTDEGFDGGSTGGGETGGETKEKYTVNFDKTAKHSRNDRILSGFSLQQTGKDKQTENVFASKAAYEDHTSKVFTVEAGSELTASFNYSGEWMNGYVYIDRDNDGEFSYTEGQWNQANTDLVAYSFYTTLDNPKVNDGNGYNSTGASVTGNARSNVNPPAFTAPTEPGTYRIRFKVDWNCILPGGSNDILSDGGGVWDATLEVVAPAPTVAETFTYDQDAFVGPNDTKGTANVKVYKMTDDSYTMEITAPVATKVGVITVGEDTKGRTTYMGEVESSTVDGVKYVVNGVVYEEGGAKHLYMTLTHDDDTYTIGENPDAPKVVSTLPFENVAYTTSMGGNGTATVTFTEMSDGTFPMTFVSDGLNVNAENLTKGEDAKGRTTYTGTAKRTDVDVTFTVKAVVYGETTAQKLYMTMDNGSSFVVTVGEDPDYVAPVTYKNTLKVVRGTDTKAYENAEVSVLAKGENKYAVTIPSFTDMDANEGTIGKLTFEATGVADGGTLKLTATSAETTQEGGNGWGTATFTASMDATVTGETLAGTFTVVYPNDVTNYTYTLYYGVEPPVAPDEPKDVTLWENYQADGTGFSKTATINWDKQKIVASIDFSNGGDDKDILAMTTGDSFTAFQTSTYRTMHWYCNQTDKQISGFFAKSDAGNNNTNRIDVADCLVKFEISKVEGLKVNGVVKMTPEVLEELLTGDPIIIGSGESPKFSKAFYNYIKVVSLDWKEPTEPEVKVEKEFTDAMSQVVGDVSQEVGQAKVTIKEMSDETINMTLAIVDQEGAEYTASGFTKAVDADKNRTTYTGTLNVEGDDFAVTALVYTEGTAEKLYMVAKGAEYNYVIGTNPDAAKVVSDKTYTSNLKLTDAESEEDVVDMAQADVNIIKYSDESYKITLKQVAFRGAENDLVFVGTTPEIAPTAEAAEPLYISAKPNTATKGILGDVTATFAISEVSADEIEMGIAIEGEGILYEGDFNYDDAETPDVYTSNLHIYDAAAPETDLFQADEATVELLFKADNTYTLAIKNVTLNEKTQDLVFTGTSAMTDITGTADEATATFLGVTSATIKYNISYDKNANLVMTFAITAGEKTLEGEFNYEKKNPDTPDPELFCKENYVADGTGFEWDINVDWDTQKIVMSIDPSTCTGKCEDVIGLGAAPTAWDNTLHLYRTSADQQLQGYFQTSAGNNNTGKFAETAPFLVEVSKAQGFVVNNEVKIAASAMSHLFTLPTVKMGTGEGKNDKSRATYKYVKVVDKDWTAPKDPETGINATTVAEGEVEFFTVNGVKLNKLQKGLNIVRTADGKVKKVLVK